MRDLLEIIWQRHTCRAAFDPHKKIRETDLHLILDAARWAPTAHNSQNFEIIAVDDPHSLAAIEAIQLPPTETFTHEHYRAMSLSEAELLDRKIGLSARMLPESWAEATTAPEAASAPIDYVGSKVKDCPMLLIVIYDGRITAHAAEGNALVMMSLGCVMQSIWLMTERLGISMQILTGFGARGPEGRVQRILDIPGHMKIAFAARLGHPTSTAESYVRVRRAIRDFTHRNRYRERQPGRKDGVA